MYVSLSHTHTQTHSFSDTKSLVPFHSAACVTFGMESVFWHWPRAYSPCWHWHDAYPAQKAVCRMVELALASAPGSVPVTLSSATHTHRVNSTNLTPGTVCGLITFRPLTTKLNRQACQLQEKSKQNNGFIMIVNSIQNQIVSWFVWFMLLLTYLLRNARNSPTFNWIKANCRI